MTTLSAKAKAFCLGIQTLDRPMESNTSAYGELRAGQECESGGTTIRQSRDAYRCREKGNVSQRSTNSRRHSDADQSGYEITECVSENGLRLASGTVRYIFTESSSHDDCLRSRTETRNPPNHARSTRANRPHHRPPRTRPPHPRVLYPGLQILLPTFSHTSFQ